MNGDHIQEKISNHYILTDPFIFFISLYVFMKDIHIHICQSYPKKFLFILFYPSSISRKYIPYDIQLWYPDYIQIYPFVTNKDIFFRYPWCYTIWLSWNILLILFLYPETISMMISNYGMLVISKYIHVYPILISILDILGVIQ